MVERSLPEADRPLPRRQRVAAYALIVRSASILLARVAPSVSPTEIWTLPGGGIEFGEAPADAVLREVYEETGLACELGNPVWVGSAHRIVDRLSSPTDLHSVRIVYDAWVAADAPAPVVTEVDGSTVEARWVPVADVEAGVVPTVPMVLEVLARHRPAVRQRLAAYAVVVHQDAVLLTRHSALGPHPGLWTLPGGGLAHGEPPALAVTRELREETGLDVEVGQLLGVHDEHFTGTAPNGREEDYHGVHLVFAASLGTGASAQPPQVVEAGGTTDDVAWVPVAEIVAGRVRVSAVVGAALEMTRRG